MDAYDLIVIGGGPGGYHAAHVAAHRGKKVLLVEKEALGGTCLNWGCIPTKTLLNIAKHFSYSKNLEDMGLTSTPQYNHTHALKWKNDGIKILQNGVQNMLKKSKVTVGIGEAYIESVSADKKIIKIINDDTSYSTENIILAGGVESYIPPIPGIETANVLTSKEILSMNEIPQKLVIVGGGVIGVEFASLFAQLGSTVTVFESMPEILPMMESDSVRILRKTLEAKQGVEFHCHTTVEKIEKQKVFFIASDGKKDTRSFDNLLISVGRKTDLSTFANVGLDTSTTGVVVDEHMMTNIPGVYAIGDITGMLQLAHVAYRMAEVAVDAITGRQSRMRYNAVPTVIYTNPELASCGLTEAQSTEQGRHIITASLPITTSGRAVVEYGPDIKGSCKIIADKQSSVILGIHIVGPMASEIISSAAVIIEAELRVQELAEIIFPHPTVGEILHNVSMILLHKIQIA